MTEQFDEGFKEVLMTLLSLGATAYETDYILDKLKEDPTPIEQKIQAVKKADDMIESPKFDAVADELIKRMQAPVAKVVAKGSPHYIIDRLVKGGLTNTAAIGIVANLQAESNVDPSIKQYGGGPGRGLAQWEKGGRFDTDRINLVKFAEDRGASWTDLDTQIDFILKEMRVHPEYKKVKAMLNNAKNVDEATMIFLRKYEKAGTPHTDKRLAYAKDLAANQG
jgi:hypothetical protein